MVRIPPHQIGLAAAVLLLAVVHATPQAPLLYSTSSSYGNPELDTPLTSFASSGNNNAGESGHTAEEPPIMHYSDEEGSTFDEPGIGPPEDSDSSQTPAQRSLKNPRRRKRSASSHSDDLGPIKDFLRSGMDNGNIDPRLLDSKNVESTGYAYESKHGSAYLTGEKAGIAGDTLPKWPSDTPKRPRNPRLTDFYKCTELVGGKECGKKHDTQAELNHHMKYHGPKKYFCKYEQCSSGFAVRDQLAKHERTVHATEKLYKCSWCGTSSSRRDVMAKHVTTKKHKAKMGTVIHHDGLEQSLLLSPS